MSSDDIAISVSNLSKRYEIYNRPGDRLKQFVIPKLCRAAPVLRRWFSKSNDTHSDPVFFNEFWAIKDVSFEIKKGETVGIIGRNGSGKSTLLQLICGTLNPTSGDIKVNGRVAALLELGAGFNPEFTGRENVRMSCALLGLSEEETEARFDEIAAFADIGDFIEQPVKTYSSGMYIRLAFSVNIVSNPDIMIVDEALSVGDVRFQAKCAIALSRLKAKGVTIIVVSHDISLVNSICRLAAYLEKAHLVELGPAERITQLYQHIMRDEIIKDREYEIAHRQEISDYPTVKERKITDSSDVEFIISKEFNEKVSLYRDGTGGAQITYVELLDEHDNELETVEFNQTVVIRIHFISNIDTGISPGYYIVDKYRNEILGAVWVGVCENELIEAKAGEKYIATFKTKLPLQDGAYSITAELINPEILDFDNERLDDVSNSVIFIVLPRPNGKCWSKVYVRNDTNLQKINI